MATPKAKNTTDLNKELILGAIAGNAFLSFFGQYVKSLPKYIDDAERDFGFDIYERMLKDPTIQSSMNAIKMQVLSKGPRFMNRVDAPSVSKPDPEQQAKHDRAEEIKVFVERMCDNLQQPLETILYEMLDFLAYGHSVAEETYIIDSGQLKLKALRVKPRANYLFVCDPYMDLQGFIGAKFDSGAALPTLSGIVDPSQVIPREKFFLLSHAPTAGDPRGTSLLRSAYNAWYLKQQTWPQYLKFLVQFGTPSIAAFLPPDSGGDVQIVDSLGNNLLNSDGTPKVATAEEAMLERLLRFVNGSAIVLPNGATLQPIEMQGDGSVYINAFNLYDTQMTRAILIAARATMEAQHGSRADSGTAQDIVGEFAEFIARNVEIGFYRDVIVPVVRYNYGDEAARELCPYMTLTNSGQQDIVGYGNMIANLARATVIHESQYPGIDSMLGLPERDFESQMEEAKAEKEAQTDKLQMFKGIVPVDANVTD
jgi:hypothetical protein